MSSRELCNYYGNKKLKNQETMAINCCIVPGNYFIYNLNKTMTHQESLKQPLKP